MKVNTAITKIRADAEMAKQKYALHISNKREGIVELFLAWPFNAKHNFTW